MLGPDGPDEEEIADLRAFGAEAELLDALRARKEAAARYEVHGDCWEAVQLFLDCQTQWRHADGWPAGLDYTGVRSVLTFRRKRPTPELFDDLRIMEDAALAAIGEVKADLCRRLASKSPSGSPARPRD